MAGPVPGAGAALPCACFSWLVTLALGIVIRRFVACSVVLLGVWHFGWTWVQYALLASVGYTSWFAAVEVQLF